MTNNYFIEATLTLLTDEQAGTRVPRVFPTHRAGHFCVDGTEWPEWIATFSPVNRKPLNPGETGPVLIHILNDDFPVD